MHVNYWHNFFFFNLLTTPCIMWDLSSPETEPVPPALAARVNNWATREVPNFFLIFFFGHATKLVKF